MTRETNNLVNWVIGFGLLFPLFYQLSGGIYNGFMQDSGGSVAKLPFPIAVLACFGGMVVTFKYFRRAYAAFAFVAAMIFAMFLSVVFGSAELRVELRKLTVLAQFIMPVFALILGQMIVDYDNTIAKAFLTVLFVVVPAQLVSSWMHGSLTLTHSLYLFSIYQHFQFVPLIFICAFAFATTSLWRTHKKLLLIFLPVMFIYTIASVSFLTMAAFVIFAAVFSFLRLRDHRNNNKALVTAIILLGISVAVGSVGAYYSKAKSKTSIVGDGGQYIGKFEALAEGKLPINIPERWADWKLFGNGIMESPRTIVFGHVEPMAREVRTSAHNWYIDFAYSFGLISLLPIVTLIVYTAYLCEVQRNKLTEQTWWLAAIVFYLVVIDSNFKVTLRQPYSGIFAYFLWGLLLSRLRGLASPRLAT